MEPNRTLLSLVAIVKDEEKTIEKTLLSVKPWIDRWAILDTGSTDKTIEIVYKVMTGMLGTLFIEPFVDYATTRNRARALAAQCGDHPDYEKIGPSTYQLSISADETLHGGDKLRAFLESYEGDESAFLIDVRTPTGVLSYPRVLKTDSKWNYEGEIHEEPKYEGEPNREPTIAIPGCWIEYEPSDPERFATRLRERDLPILTKRVAKETGVSRCHTALLLAQTRDYLASGYPKNSWQWMQEQVSALAWYMFVLKDGDTNETMRSHALFRYLNLAESEMLDLYTSSEMLARLKPLAKLNPKHPALAYMVARHSAAVDPREGMREANRAALIAQAEVKDPNNPHDPHGLLWLSHHLAASCAKALGHGPAMKKSAAAGIAAGGPADLFKEFLE